MTRIVLPASVEPRTEEGAGIWPQVGFEKARVLQSVDWFEVLFKSFNSMETGSQQGEAERIRVFIAGL